MQSFALSFASMLLALAAVLALAWLVLRLLRSRLQAQGAAGVKGGKSGKGAKANDALRFVRALPLGPKERVVLIEHQGARWMLGVTSGNISTIAHWPAASDVNADVDAETAVEKAPDASSGVASAQPAGAVSQPPNSQRSHWD